MISITDCRKLIPDNERFTDKEIEEIRANLYGLANLALEVREEKEIVKSDIL